MEVGKMSVLDKDTFALYTDEHQKYLDAKFAAVCSKIDSLRVQRDEDKEDAQRDHDKCQGNFDKKFEENGKKHRATRVALVAGIFLSMVVGSALEGHLTLIELFNAIGRALPF
jgi:hypothetical protein